MTYHKLTDNEIIKALNCCAETEYCATCLARDFCKGMDSLMENSLALINRQKAEIERLETENKLLIVNDVRDKYPNCVSVEKGRIYTRTLEDYDELIGDISAEAIKEFAKFLIDKSTDNVIFISDLPDLVIIFGGTQ